MPTDSPQPVLFARLDKRTRTCVLCAHTSCRGAFGRVLSLPDGVISIQNGQKTYLEAPMTYTDGRPADGPFRVRLLAFAQGWVQAKDGTWYLSKRAKGQLARGETPTTRHRMREPRIGAMPLRHLHSLQEQDPDAPVPPASSDPASERTAAYVQEFVLCEYPAWAICPACELRQILDAQILDCSTDMQILDESSPFPDDWVVGG